MRRLYMDIEAIKATEPVPEWAMPRPLPPLDVWAEDQQPPVVPSIEDLAPPKSYKDEAKIAAWREERHARLQAEQDAWMSSMADRYEAERQAVQSAGREVWDRSSLIAILGGHVWCVGIAVDDGDVKVVRRDTETDTLVALQRGIEAHVKATDGQLTIYAWNGFGYDFRFVCQRAQRLAAIEQDPDKRARLAALVGWLQYEPPWRSKTLADPMIAWQQGARGRDSIGKLWQVAEFYGAEIPDWYRELDHSQVHDWWLAGELDIIDRMCAEDVRLLRHVVQHQLFCGLRMGA